MWAKIVMYDNFDRHIHVHHATTDLTYVIAIFATMANREVTADVSAMEMSAEDVWLTLAGAVVVEDRRTSTTHSTMASMLCMLLHLMH